MRDTRGRPDDVAGGRLLGLGAQPELPRAFEDQIELVLLVMGVDGLMLARFEAVEAEQEVIALERVVL